jgi:hypothetical protein
VASLVGEVAPGLLTSESYAFTALEIWSVVACPWPRMRSGEETSKKRRLEDSMVYESF